MVLAQKSVDSTCHGWSRGEANRVETGTLRQFIAKTRPDHRILSQYRFGRLFCFFVDPCVDSRRLIHLLNVARLLRISGLYCGRRNLILRALARVGYRDWIYLYCSSRTIQAECDQRVVRPRLGHF